MSLFIVQTRTDGKLAVRKSLNETIDAVLRLFPAISGHGASGPLVSVAWSRMRLAGLASAGTVNSPPLAETYGGVETVTMPM